MSYKSDCKASRRSKLASVVGRRGYASGGVVSSLGDDAMLPSLPSMGGSSAGEMSPDGDFSSIRSRLDRPRRSGGTTVNITIAAPTPAPVVPPMPPVAAVPPSLPPGMPPDMPQASPMPPPEMPMDQPGGFFQGGRVRTGNRRTHAD